MNTQSTFTRRVRNSLFLATLAALLFVATDARGQANHNVTRSNKTQPAADTGPDNDCDGVCGAVRGTVSLDGQRLVLIIDQAGGAPARIPLTEGDAPDRGAQLDPTPIYMSINDGGVQLADPGDGSSGPITGTAASAAAQDYNSSRSNNTARVTWTFTDGTLEHTDDWVAARVAATDDGSNGPAYTKDFNSARSNVSNIAGRETAPDSFFDVTFLHIPTDVHSGRLTGVRQHSPRAGTPTTGAATATSYRAQIDGKGGFIVHLPATPGTYRIVVSDGRGQTHRGHVTVLK